MIDQMIGVELTLDEARVLLVSVLAALEGTPANIATPDYSEAANSAAARLQNRIAQCAMNPANCPTPKGAK